MLSLNQVLEDIIVRTEDDIDRTLTGMELTQNLWNEFYCLFMVDKAEARVAACTFFTKVMMQLTESQRDQTLKMFNIAMQALKETKDKKDFFNYLTEKLKTID